MGRKCYTPIHMLTLSVLFFGGFLGIVIHVQNYKKYQCIFSVYQFLNISQHRYELQHNPACWKEGAAGLKIIFKTFLRFF